MTAVQNIETAIGEADPQTFFAPAPGALNRLVERGELNLGARQTDRQFGLDEFVTKVRGYLGE